MTAKTDYNMIRPFRINIESTQFADLREKVANSRLASGLNMAGWEMGTPKNALCDVLKYWTEVYDWSRKEEELNSFPQYVWETGGMRIHFFHLCAAAKDAPTILMCHGWPDSFLRYAKTFTLLKDYNLVVPSMPGFTFSTLPDKGFLNNSDVADLWHVLMTENLGYKSYFVTGGDMGRGVACYLADRYPVEIKGLFLTDMGFARDIMTAPENTLTADELKYKEAATKWMRFDGAYINIQSTKPLSLGYALSDSPAGMAGWLLEKFHDWSDWEHFSMDDLCDNLTLYWMCNCAATSIMMYHGNAFTLPPMGRIMQPIGIAQFPKDILPVPKTWIERNLFDKPSAEPSSLELCRDEKSGAKANYNLVQYSEMPYGGHFTAMEAPVPFSRALSEFVDRL